MTKFEVLYEIARVNGYNGNQIYAQHGKDAQTMVQPILPIPMSKAASKNRNAT